MGIGSSHQEMGMDPIEKYIMVKKISDNKTVLRSPTNNHLFLTFETTFSSTEQLSNYQNQLKKKINITHQHYLSPIQHYVIASTNLCSKQYRLIQLYPYQGYNLSLQVENRVVQKRSFTWKEVWSILCSCVLAMGHLTRNQIVHYTLNPQDIILSSQGTIKIVAQQISQFIFDYGMKDGFYYSPQMLKAIRNSAPITLNNKSGVFTLGLTILYLIYLKPLTFLYNLDQQTIDYQNLNKHIQKVADDDIRNILKKMVKVAPYERITFTELEEMLYGILERKNTQSEELQRLENSICKLSREEETLIPCSQELVNNHYALQPDIDDVPNKIYALPGNDIEKNDEKQITIGKSIVHEDNPLSDITNHLSFKQLDSNQSNEEKLKIISLSSRTHKPGQQYVTEEYTRGKYQGYKEAGMRHGFGTFYFIEGGKYSGQWVRNKMQGRGALYYCDGNIAYEGDWKKDQLHGYGVLYNQAPKYISQGLNWKMLDFLNMYWVKYEGNFKEDQKHGEGTLYLSNGEYFKGVFQNDIPQGEGFYKNINGTIIKGCWKKGLYMEKKKN